MADRHEGSAPDDRSTPTGRGLDPTDPARRPLVARIDPVAHLPRSAAPAPRTGHRDTGATGPTGATGATGRPSPWSAAGAVALAAVAALVGGLVVTTATEPAAGTVLASDAMSRTVDGSWGDAPVGGTYALAASSSTADSAAAEASVVAPAPAGGPASDSPAIDSPVAGAPADDPTSAEGATEATTAGPADDQATSTLGADVSTAAPATTGTADAGSAAAAPPAPAVGPDTVFGVRGGVGVMSLPRGTSATATLPDDDRLDLQAAAQFSVAELPTSGNGVFASLNLRDGDGSSYQGRVRIGVGGTVLVSIIRQDGGPAHLTRLAGEVALPTRVTAQDPVRVEASVIGQDPVQLQVRAWQLDQPDRVVTLGATDTAEDRLADAGAVAVWGYVSTGSTDAELRVDDLSVTALGGGEPTAPTTSPTTAPVTSPSTDPTTTAPATAAPTTTDPTTAAPTTTGPTTTAPTTTAPVTTAPTTSAPSSPDPVTPPVPSPPPTSGTATDAGAGPVGSARYPVPAGAYFVSTSGDDNANGSQSQPWRTVATAATRAPSGATIVVRGGSYHERVIIPNGKRLTIQSYPGEAVWFDGSVPVTSWQSQGGTWVASGWTTEFDTSQSFSRGSNEGGMVNPARPLAADPQQLFVDGAQLVQVAAGTRPGPGQFAVDTAADTLTIGSDPTGHSVRASDLTQAFLIAGPLTLRGVGVQRYATPLPTMGTVYLGGNSEGSLLEDVTVVDNATQGISVGETDVVLRHVTASRNGMTGIHGNNADRSAVVDSLIEGNNTQQFNRAPSAGGIKITRTRGFTADGNVVRNNIDVNGIWLDESVVDFAITRNTITDNGISYGMPIELSANGIVAGNTVTGAQWGVALINSGNVQVYNNYFAGIANNDIRLRQDARREATSSGWNRDRRQPQPDLTVPWLTQDITISNNVLSDTTTGGGGHQINVLDTQTNIGASDMRITITGNLFAARRTGNDSFLVGWGASDNRTVQAFDSVRAFQDTVGAGPNTEVTGEGPIPTSTVQANAGAAVPIPAAVAQAMGVDAGSRFLGPQG